MKSVPLAWRAWLAIVFLLCMPWPAFGEGPAFVVATPELRGPFKGSVILAVPFEDGHIGIIINRPSDVALVELFPDHEPSRKVKEPVYLGGPVKYDLLFAMVAGASPHPTAIQFMPGLWLVSHADTIDRIIEQTPNGARYFAGFVAWGHGELLKELADGYFVLREADKSKAMLPDTSGLWNELAPAPKKAGQVGT